MLKRTTLFVCAMAIAMFGFAQNLAFPIDFESTTIPYTFTDFDGGNATVITNPQSNGINTSATVGQMIKSAGQVWGGSLLTFDSPIDFSSNKTFKLKVFSPRAGAKLLLKVENLSNAGIAYQKEETIMAANTWEEITFDYSLVSTTEQYSKLVFIFDLGTMGDSSANFTFLFDDIELINTGSSLTQIDLPVTFEDTTVDQTLTDFGNVVTTLVADPMDATNTVAMTNKPLGAELWGGTTMSTPAGLATAIAFTATETKMTARVYSPDAGIPVRLKVEDASDPTKSVETEAMTTVANAWETLEFDFSNEAAGTAALNLSYTFNKASIFFNFGTDGNTAGDKTYMWDDVQFGTSGTGGLSQIDLPVTFEDTTVDQTLTDFGGIITTLITDPSDATNTVASSNKPMGAELWGGTTMSTPSGFASAIPFSATETKMSVRVYSPDAGIPIRLKVEDAADGTKSVETETSTTVANAWETLEFDFSNEVAGTAAINLSTIYNKASIFFNFGTDGNTAGDKTYLWDDAQFLGDTASLAQIDLPVTFEDATVDQTLTDFGGIITTLIADPADASNTVASSNKPMGAELWGGTTMSTDDGFATAIPFTATETKMSVRVYSPDAGIPVRLKVEDAADGTKSVETETSTTLANAWETLEFDFSNEVSGTAAINLATTYNKASIFFNFGTDGNTAGDKTYLWDDAQFVADTSTLAQIDLPVTFEDSTVDQTLTDFGGVTTTLIADPADATNTVASSNKPLGAELWGGTTMSTSAGFATAIPFTATETKMSVRVYSPDAGIPVRLKVEDVSDPTKSVETESSTTVANAWETIEFDFSNEVSGTAALDLTTTYGKASIFFNFGTDGNTAGDKTYMWDDAQFVGDTSMLAQIDMPVTFEDTTVDQTMTDFGGVITTLIPDPADATNTIASTSKPMGAELWGGTTMSTPAGFASAMAFSATETKINIRVYSPDAGIPIRLKVEDAADATKSVETETMTTVANEWETLEFDFSNHVAGTAALDLTITYDKASIFFNFGTDGNTAGDKTYMWDDVIFGEKANSIIELEALGLRYYPNPVQNQLVVRADLPFSKMLVYNHMGQVVLNGTANSQEEVLDMSNLSSGVYFVKVRIGDVAGTFKVIKY